MDFSLLLGCDIESDAGTSILIHSIRLIFLSMQFISESSFAIPVWSLVLWSGYRVCTRVWSWVGCLLFAMFGVGNRMTCHLAIRGVPSVYAHRFGTQVWGWLGCLFLSHYHVWHYKWDGLSFGQQMCKPTDLAPWFKAGWRVYAWIQKWYGLAMRPSAHCVSRIKDLQDGMTPL